MSDALPPPDAHPVANLVDVRDQSRIGEMFDQISPRYDLMNRVMTGGQDVRWRRLAADAACLGPGMRALDVATGTGDLARELAKRVLPGGEVVGVDISRAMMDIGRAKLAGWPVQFDVRDAMDLGFVDEFDAATVAFGLRNFPDRRRGLGHMVRALRPGGRLVVLELTPTRSRLAPLLNLYTRRVIPLLGRLIAGQSAAYTYLPQSVEAMLTPEAIAGLFRDIGLAGVGFRRLNFGMVALCWGSKAGF